MAIVITLVSQNAQSLYFGSHAMQMKDNILSGYKDELKNRAELIEQHIKNQYLLSEKKLKDDISQRVLEAHQIAQSLYNTYHGKKSENELKSLIISALRDIRFHSNRGYYFIDDTDGNCILYPIRPDLEGKNILTIQDANKKYVVKDFINIALAYGSGFSEYATYKYKFEEDATRYKKIAYVKIFEPYHWILGTGEYLDDVENDTKKDIAQNISKLKISQKTSFINIFEVNNFKGGANFATMVASLHEEELINNKIDSSIQDIDGKEYIKESLDFINNYGAGFVTYKDKKPNSDEILHKLMYVKLLKDWNWVIATGIELGELDFAINENKTKMLILKKINQHRAFISFSIVFVLLVIASLFISKKINIEIEKIKVFFKKAVLHKEKIDTTKFYLEDFKTLATLANDMLEKINLQQEELQNANEKLEFSVVTKTEELLNLNYFLEEKNQELQKNYFTDTLTGLENRNSFLKELTNAKNPIAFIFDIDGFKNINDFYGTSSGDKLLIEIANFMRNYAQTHGMLPYRLSSDEFLLFLDKNIDKDFLHVSIKNFMEVFLKEEFYDSANKNRLHIDLTCGAVFGGENLLGKADIALNYAKKKKLSFAIYDEQNPHMNTHKHNIYWRDKIQWAISEDLVVPFFQPIVDVREKHVKKYEALIRIKDADDIIAPYSFLGVAKETKQYLSLTKIMIEKSFAKFSKTDIEFSINISLQDIEDAQLLEFLTKKIDEYAVGGQLILEILESEDIIQSEKFLPFVSLMRKKGVKFALDDFGSGYSNFAFLLKMHPKYLKIDGSLIKAIAYDENSYNIVKTITLFAKQMNATIIAEFVENEKIVEILKDFDIHLMQGYHFAPPSENIEI